MTNTDCGDVTQGEDVTPVDCMCLRGYGIRVYSPITACAPTALPVPKFSVWVKRPRNAHREPPVFPSLTLVQRDELCQFEGMTLWITAFGDAAAFCVFGDHCGCSEASFVAT